MDQLKVALQIAKKHHFWILCGVITVTFLGSWMIGSRSVQQQEEQSRKEILDKFNTGQQILGKGLTVGHQVYHPNDSTHQGMDALVEQLSEEVYKAWNEQYLHQDAVLTWPRELREDFIAQVIDLRPIELKVPFPTPSRDELHVDYRKRYLNYIDLELPKLAELIGAKWQVDPDSGSGSEGAARSPMGGRSGAMGRPRPPGTGRSTPGTGRSGTGRSGMESGEQEDVDEAIVYWNAANQQELQDQHFNWPDQQDRVPTTLQMLYTQESLWVLKALMMIIKNTNGDADARYNAAIKEIDFIRLGRDAVGRAGEVTRLASGQAGAGGMGVLGGPGAMGGGSGMGEGYGEGVPGAGSEMGGMAPGGMAPGGMAPGGMAGEGMGQEGAARDPADRRYVDNHYQPLTAEKIRSAATSDNPEDAFLAVAKRMPVRMRLVMDQRRLGRLLAECGNSNLPVEIRQVRINRPPADAASSGGAMGGYGGGGGARSGGSMGGASAGRAQRPGRTGSAEGMGYGQQEAPENPYDVPVELYGIVYIYNPVDIEKLGIEKVGEDSQQDSPEAAPPGPAAGETAG